MPRKSYRRIALDGLQREYNKLRRRFLVKTALDNDSDDDEPPDLLPRCSYGCGYDEDDSESDEELEVLLPLFNAKRRFNEVNASRYFARSSKYRKFDHTVFEKHLDEKEGCFLNDEEYKKQYRTSRSGVDFITGKIENHSVFNNVRGRRQAPVKEQVMLLLHFLGEESVSNHSQRSVYWRSTGHCEAARERCVEAILSLRDEYLPWPGEEERKETARRILKNYQIPNCVGIEDGTLLELAFTPECDDAADYSGRKYPYSLSSLIVNDDTGKILYFLAGFPGTSHDNRQWKKSKLYQRKDEYFTRVEYLIGDTAFEPSDVMVSAYKNMPGVTMTLDEANLNSAMKPLRVRGEHTIGIWKGRFPWLRKIRMIITNDKQSLVDILKIIECCVILHNMLLKFGDESPEEWDDGISDIDDAERAPEEEAMHQPIPDGSPKDARRTTLCNYIRERYIRGSHRRRNNEEDSDDEIMSALLLGNL